MFSILAFTNEKKSNIFNEETMNFFISLMFPIFSALQKCINLKFTIYFSFITTFSIRKCSWCFVICRNIMIDLKDAFEKLILMSYIKNSFEELKNRTKTKKKTFIQYFKAPRTTKIFLKINPWKRRARTKTQFLLY
jgi:hypothetical protein